MSSPIASVVEGPGTAGTAIAVAKPQPQEPRIAALKKLPMVVRKELLASLPPADRLAIEHDWRLWARPKQLPPPGQWEVWFCCGGRGAGKSRTGAEFAHWKAETMPGSRGALIGATADDVRYTMVEGDSGLLAHMKPQNPVRYWPAKRLLRWKNGAQARTFTPARSRNASAARSIIGAGSMSGRRSSIRRKRGISSCSASGWGRWRKHA